MGNRKRIPELLYQEVRGYYGGGECVVLCQPHIRGTLHHLNGDPTAPHKFENLLPVEHTLQARLVLHSRSRKGKQFSTGDGLLDPQELRRIARGHYNEGKTQQALGCARLAHAVRRYYRQRDVNDELRSLLDVLYYLRRCLIRNQSASYRILRYILTRDIIPALESNPVLSPSVVFMLLEEMGACLNELGAYQSGIRVLRFVQKRASSPALPIEHSRFRSGVFRQYAFCLICCEEDGLAVTYALEQALDHDDSNHNIIGVTNAKALLHLARGDAKQAFDTVNPIIHEVKKDMRTPGHPEIIGCSYENYLALLSTDLLARAQLREHSFVDALERYKDEERCCGASVRFSWPPLLRCRLLKIGRGTPSFGQFLEAHMTNVLPKDIVKQCEKVVRLVMAI